MFISKEFGERLKKLREDKGLSVTNAAALLGVSRMGLTHWEWGDREPPLAKLCQMAEYYGVSADYLLGLPEKQQY